MKCPRREELGNPSVFKLPDEDTWDKRLERTGLSCSYCGSMHPDDFMKKLEAGELIVPTDKNYKVYVGERHEKFYFQHLSQEQQIKLIELLNAKKINFGVPGYFYVLPFFCEKKVG